MGFTERFKNGFEKTKQKIGDGAVKVARAAADHPELTTVGVAVGSKLIWELGRKAKRNQIEKIERERRLDVYDRTYGIHAKMRRLPTASELRKYREMVDNGWSQIEALDKLHLLKN